MDIHVDCQELIEVLEKLKTKTPGVVARMTPIIAEMIVSAVHDVYDAEGPGWKDLAEVTKRMRRGTSYKILNDTGVMEKSTAPAHGPDWAEARGGAAYTIFHVTGTVHMVARDPFNLGQFGEDVQKDTADLLLTEICQ